MYHSGNSLVVQWSGLCFQGLGPEFDPWSGNQDPISLKVRPKKIFFKYYSGIVLVSVSLFTI